MSSEKRHRLALRICAWVVLALVLLAVDLVTKQIAGTFLADGKKVTFLAGFIDFRFVRNEGIAFGIGEGNTFFMVFITILTVVLSVGIGIAAFTLFKNNRAARIPLAFLEAGALGNLADRLIFGYVRDFLDMSAFRPFAWMGWDFNFGVCNVADYFITLGAVALIVVLLFIGPTAAFPLKKSWREEAKRREESHGAD